MGHLGSGLPLCLALSSERRKLSVRQLRECDLVGAEGIQHDHQIAFTHGGRVLKLGKGPPEYVHTASLRDLGEPLVIHPFDDIRLGCLF